jgi:exodeoxyribonuclease V alpha subunit
LAQTAKKQSAAAEVVQGTIARRIFYNADNGYCVLAVRLTNNDEDVKMNGQMASIREGDEYRFTGQWTTHPKYGPQFKFTEAELVMPTGAKGLARYLSNITSGVGIVKARKIVEALGEDALEKLKANPEVLNTHPGLSFLTPDQKADIMKDLTENSVQAELSALICREGIGPGMVTRIYTQYGADSVKVVKENPYILADEVWGVGFLKADAIAQAVGIEPNSPYRVEAALNYVLKEAANEGHCFLQPNDIVKRLIGRKGLVEASGVEIADVAAANQRIIDDGRCVREGDAVYEKGLYIAECIVAMNIRTLLIPDDKAFPGLDDLIASTQKEVGFEYEANQKQAIKTALNSGISVITGGPGTGKTTVLNAICKIYAQCFPDNELYLCAPTGRAAKRMSEATGRDSRTIHRLLRYNPAYGDFEFHSENPLPGPGLIVVDEASMIDIELMADLLEAAVDLQVILVGDIDQLPSVGPGSVLRDCIASEQVPTVRLEYNYRQAGGSKISEFANLVCQGEVPPLMSVGDFEYAPVEDADQAVEIVKNLVMAARAEGLGLLDFQILSPMHRGSAGVKNLNEVIRELVNPKQNGKPELGWYRLGDKVMVTKNNYDLGVFNGDLGIIKHIEKGKLTIDFGDFVQEFAMEHLDLLTLAYASTIHKSQGSEFPLVIMPIVNQHYIMLQRNLIYTGMTRAKKRLVLVGDERAVKRAVKNNKIEQRWSMLAERIRGKEGLA